MAEINLTKENLRAEPKKSRAPILDTQSTQVNWDFLQLTEETTIGQLPTHTYRISQETIVKIIDKKLRTEPLLPGVIIVAPDGGLNVISRRRFFELTSIRYGVAVFLNRPIQTMLKSIRPPLILSEHEPIPNAVKAALNREIDQVYEPILIHKESQSHTNSHFNCDLLDVYTLLMAQSRLFATLQGEMVQVNDMLEARVRHRTAELLKLNERLGNEIMAKSIAEDNLKTIIRYEKAIASCGDTLLSSEDDTNVIPEALEILRHAVKVGRVFFGKYIKKSEANVENQIKILFEAKVASAHGLTGRLLPFRLPENDFNRFWQGDAIALYPQKEPTGPILNLKKCHALLMLPVGQFGIIAFDALETERVWGNDEINLLKTVANMLYSYLERYANRQALAMARDRALDANAFKGELLAKVSHELRTPLGAILGYAQLLLLGSYGPLNDSQKEPTELIIGSTNYLSTIVDGLLDQAQLDREKLVLINSPFDLRLMIEEVASRMRVLAHHKGLVFTVKISKKIPQIILGDRLRLQQILTNVISNAVKFTEDGFISVIIWPESGPYWLLEISDSGPGIPAEAQTKIFEPFGQADGSPTRTNRGTGLGLSITRQLVEAMDGEISVESELERGSKFKIRLPLNLPDHATKH